MQWPDLRDPRHRAMAASLAVSVLMLVGKFTAYLLTGSAAIFSDAAESLVHILATAFVAFSLWYALQPPDPDHPYGHGKIAYFSAGFEGAMILLAAAGILYTAVQDLLHGPELRRLGLGVLLTALFSLINLLLGLYLIRVGRRHHSLVLEANGRHVLTDMWTSLGVVVGVALVAWSGVVWLDPLLAIVVALNILRTAFQLLRQAVAGLMERVDEEDTRRLIEVLDEAVQQGIISDYHQLRHRRTGDQLWVEYHLMLPGERSLEEAHAQAHRVEEAIQQRFPDRRVYVTAHLEPEHHEVAHPAGHREPEDPLKAQARR
ncbi:cation diffusion facilitator family transporter [Rhodothermus marinus]|uniref:cation diffusion facilitator family transporter n=1 Tax=Rhodothermus marinus TaxID=29549 RepID=UPI001E385C18|nr:cation diffusion facilitator family transporter [Rhodothermus marinus]